MRPPARRGRRRSADGLLAWVILAIVTGCQPAASPTPAGPPDAQPPAARSECREDIPDCSALCALRETGRAEYLDFFERRCAAVMQGKNPNKIVTDLEPTPYTDGGLVDPATSIAAAGSVALPASTPAFDPTSVGRTGSDEPPECKASRLLRAQKHDREADVLAALCAAKGGDAGLN